MVERSTAYVCASSAEALASSSVFVPFGYGRHHFGLLDATGVSTHCSIAVVYRILADDSVYFPCRLLETTRKVSIRLFFLVTLFPNRTKAFPFTRMNNAVSP
eukprot:gb/GECG01006885.1/.p1 GENE.gb/GECG01006885.1/~~gb/GECG01006885.1/.p1  ORF type:complete len:102 (+),score=9.41 gb/GECG01006885.1/:1-306(+)